ncbi:MAG: response regulator transcription factor [Candidatus Limnocylindrales bacterium]
MNLLETATPARTTIPWFRPWADSTIVSGMGSRILVADDEPHIREVVRAYLEREGYEVLEAADGDTALEHGRNAGLDLLVLDVMLPQRSGFEVLRALRSEGSSVGVLMLTARDDVIDRVAGLELGADDYVTKPFEPREVVARVGAILRRFGRPVGAAPASGAVDALPARPATTFFDLTIDIDSRDVSRAGTSLPLTRTELDVLAALAEGPGRVWTREQIGQRVFSESFDTFDRTIDSHVKNLRAKLGPRPDGGSYVETVRGVGYRAARPADPA